MKKHLLKTMLVATGLLTSTLGTWADGTITATLVHTSSTSCGNSKNNVTNTIDSEKEHYNNTTNNIWQGFAFAEFSVTIPDGEAIKSATLNWQAKQGGSKNRNHTICYLNIGESLDYEHWSNITSANSQSFESKKTEIATISGGFDQNRSTDVTDAVKAVLAKQNNIIFQWSNNAGGADLLGKGSSTGAPTLIIETMTASSSTSYTVKFQDENGNEIKSAKTSTTAIGSDITADNDDLANIYNADKTKKYIYKSGNTTIKAAEDATQNVITLVFREAETWNYTINCNAGDYTKKITGTGLEGETVNVGYPYAINNKGTLYTINTKSSSDGKGYYINLALSKNNLTKDLTYSATDTKNVVYLSEAEDIDGLTQTTNGNTAIRSSNGGSAYAKDGNIEFTKLPAGVYTLTACVCDASGKNVNSTWNFLAEETIVFQFNVTTINWQLGTSEAFVLKEETPIYLAQGGSNNAGVDFLYIQKISDVATISSAEYATYVTTSAVKVPENVKVYTVKANTTGIETAELAAGTVIPAGTAVVLNAEAGDYTFELADEAGTKPANNDLNPATADITADGTQYCLTQNDEGKVGFAKVQAGLNIPAGKAYLVVNNTQAANFFALDGSVTAIKNVEAAQADDNAYYTLQGVKVEHPTKGIYIKNGKKVVIK